jgi:hypothetical protein
LQAVAVGHPDVGNDQGKMLGFELAPGFLTPRGNIHKPACALEVCPQRHSYTRLVIHN